MSSTPEPSDIPDVPEFTSDHDREAVLAQFEEAMDEAFRKFTDGRVRNPENEKVRIQWLRAYTYAVATYRQLVADIEETDHEERLATLEHALDDAEAEH